MVAAGRSARVAFALALTVGLAVLGGDGARAAAETPIPEAPARWVTDAASFLSPATARALDERLARYATDTGHQVLVYVDRTTGGAPIEDWAARAFARWKVGRHGIDDGLVLFIFGDDRHLRIEVGYGLEDRVTDLVASHVI
ncbi:MAG: rane protein, partial [Myxococcales bacterium]|nr:rane protein [Myxococcales bacterium]